MWCHGFIMAITSNHKQTTTITNSIRQYITVLKNRDNKVLIITCIPLILSKKPLQTLDVATRGDKGKYLVCGANIPNWQLNCGRFISSRY